MSEADNHQPSPEIETIVFDGEWMRIGLFRCPPWYPYFADTGPIQGYLLVFPRTSVGITHAGGDPIVADPNIVMFYNRSQLYQRHKLSERGDWCDWFAFKPEVVVEALRPFDPTVVDHPERPFQLTHGPSDARSYLLQRLVVRLLTCSQPFDPFFVEEMSLFVLNKVVEFAYLSRGCQPKWCAASAQAGQRELAQAAQSILSTRFQERLTLSELAGQLYCSPYHLCRIFRRQTGYSLHHYLTQVRLRTALEQVEQGAGDLTRLACELGFTHHSHFTQAFRRLFGLPPSGARALLSRPNLLEMSKNLIA
ncbi:MAG: helix-turn-helix transcriptional regulator [Anaerolineae bacterium]